MGIILNIEQGSPLWHELRSTSLGATSASVLSGVNPWKTEAALYDEMVEGKTVPMNERMQRGMDLEPIARKLYEDAYSVKLFTPTLRHKSIPFMHASLDGLSECGKYAVEIKCSEKCYREALIGIIPVYYQYQLQQQMGICGLKSMHYVAYWEGEIEVIEYEFDENLWQNIEINAINFYESHIRPKTRPLTSKDKMVELVVDDEERTELEYNFSNLELVRNKIKALEKMEKHISDQILSRATGDSFKFNRWSVTKCERKGNVNYKFIPQLEGVNLDDFRGESITYWKIS